MSVSRLLQTSPVYILVAAFCVVLNNSLLVGLDFLCVHYVAASVISASVLVPTSYFLHCALTYSKSPSKASFFSYAKIQALNVPATIILLFFFYDLCELSMLHSAILLTLTMFLFNFLGSYITIDRFGPKQIEGIRP